jgi:AcrR family transcriptional regulator
MAKDTPDKIRRAALKLFSTRWFETVSIAEICREAEVSNGVFYRYYSNKGELVRDLLDEFLAQFEAELQAIDGDSPDQRLAKLFDVIFKAGSDHAAQVTVFREGQYRFPEYEERLREIFLDCCRKVYLRDVSEAEYLFIISGLRFNSTRALYDGLPRRADIIADFVRKGMFCEAEKPETPLEIPSQFEDFVEPPPRDSREKLLDTGMRLIGQRGYYAIGVADIVRENNLAVGTFYTYFESKEEFFSIIIEKISQRTRHFLSDRARTHHSRLEREIYGVWHFLSYFHRHVDYYAIVREAEFVAKPWVRKYYDAFESGYMHNLEIDDPETRRIAANFLMGLSHYIGIEALMNKRIVNIPKFINELAELLCKGVAA